MTIIKLLIFSDSHGDTGTMLDVAQRERPDEIIHLGDCLRDAQTLSFAVPEVHLVTVPGNCDGWTRERSSLVLQREGARILLGHGHQWQVKSGSSLAVAAAREAGADILLYGHTHRAVCRREGALWVLNPGTVGGCWAPPTYGLILLEGDAVDCKILPVPET